MKYERGDVKAGFKEAAIVLENTVRTQRVHHGYLEPRASVASVDINGKVNVWSDNQSIFIVRETVASFLEIPFNRVRVIPVEVGGAFCGKSPQPLATRCSLLSKITVRPAKLLMPVG